MKTYLVTGAAGFIGSHLSRRLLEDGHAVVGIDALTDYYDVELKRANVAVLQRHPSFQWLCADIRELDLRAQLRNVEGVFHLAGQPGVRGSWGANFSVYARNNIDATQRLLEAVRESDVRRVVYASSSSVYGSTNEPMREDDPTRPHSPYGVTKLAAEHLALLYAKNFGLPVNAVRYFTVFGPGQRPDMAFAKFMLALRADRELHVYGDGTQTRDFTYISDAVDGTILAGLRGASGEVYNIGGGCTASLAQAIAAIERVSGRRARVVHESPQEGDVRSTLADTSKARRELGFRPSVDLERGLALQWNGLANADRPRPSARPVDGAKRDGRRVMLYSHDTFGLGHLRRNLAIATELLRRDPRDSAMLVTGSPVIDSWPLPENLHVRRLPPVLKIAAEEYVARDRRESFDAVKRRRERVIREAVEEFAPDVLLVDHAPLGMKGELLETLSHLRSKRSGTKIVLGLRDVLDDSRSVCALWQAQGVYDALDLYYDRILVYGMRDVFAVDREYAFTDRLVARTRYCGYVANSAVSIGAGGLADPGTRPRSVLVTAGGGGDGYPLLMAYLKALEFLPHRRLRTTLVPGPLMDDEQRRTIETLAGQRDDVRVVPFTLYLTDLIRDADCIVSMAGYNTSVEIVASAKPAILVPRDAPRLEQRIRATLLEQRGLARTLNSAPDLPDRLAALVWSVLSGSSETPVRPRREIDIGGVARVRAELASAAFPADAVEMFS